MVSVKWQIKVFNMNEKFVLIKGRFYISIRYMATFYHLNKSKEISLRNWRESIIQQFILVKIGSKLDLNYIILVLHMCIYYLDQILVFKFELYIKYNT